MADPATALIGRSAGSHLADSTGTRGDDRRIDCGHRVLRTVSFDQRRRDRPHQLHLKCTMLHEWT